MYGCVRCLASLPDPSSSVMPRKAGTGRSIILASSKMRAVCLLAGSVHQALTDLVIVLLRRPAGARRLGNCGISDSQRGLSARHVFYSLSQKIRACHPGLLGLC